MYHAFFFMQNAGALGKLHDMAVELPLVRLHFHCQIFLSLYYVQPLCRFQKSCHNVFDMNICSKCMLCLEFPEIRLIKTCLAGFEGSCTPSGLEAWPMFSLLL